MGFLAVAQIAPNHKTGEGSGLFQPPANFLHRPRTVDQRRGRNPRDIYDTACPVAARQGAAINGKLTKRINRLNGPTRRVFGVEALV